jgi:phosphoglycolate phosphatase
MPGSAPAPSVLLFDLDGTLIDSAADICDAINALLTEHGRRTLTEAEVRTMIGDGSAELVRRAFAATGPALAADASAQTVARYLGLYAAQPVRSDCLYPGVIATLDRLTAAGYRLSLCTNKPERITRTLLRALDLERLFPVVLGAEVLPVRKPDPGPLLWVLERLNARPADAVMIGDSRNDVLAARAAGMPVIAVSYGYAKMPAAELGADKVVDHFPALESALAGMTANPDK